MQIFRQQNDRRAHCGQSAAGGEKMAVAPLGVYPAADPDDSPVNPVFTKARSSSE
jgi:hypothetical protein